MNEVSETESRSSSHQSKRPKYSTEPSETFPAAQPSDSTPIAIPKTPKTPLPTIKTPELIFTAEDIERARKYASELSSLYETEKHALKEVFEEGRKRDVRRANEAETHRNEAVAEYAGRLKFKEAVFTQELGRQKEQAQLESERHEQEIARLKTELEQLRSSREIDNQVQNGAGDDDLRQQLAKQEGQLRLYDQLRTSMASEAEKPLKSSTALGSKTEEVKVQHTLLTNVISKINVELEDLSGKAIARCLKEMQDINESLLEKRKEEKACLEETMIAVELFVKPFRGAAETEVAAPETDIVAGESATSPRAATTARIPEVVAIASRPATPIGTGSPRRRTAR